MIECKETEHSYRLLETADFEDKEVWIFYCKKCLDIRMKQKIISIGNVS